MAGAYPSGAIYKGWLISLTFKSEVTGSDKTTSLLHSCINYGRKQFYSALSNMWFEGFNGTKCISIHNQHANHNHTSQIGYNP
jgi:hypothetical protein